MERTLARTGNGKRSERPLQGKGTQATGTRRGSRLGGFIFEKCDKFDAKPGRNLVIGHVLMWLVEGHEPPTRQPMLKAEVMEEGRLAMVVGNSVGPKWNYLAKLPFCPLGLLMGGIKEPSEKRLEVV